MSFDLKQADPAIYTNAVQGLVDLLQETFPGKSFKISDTVDDDNFQYVDLVQEGGGVHGIALAGYTYILEKMQVSFSQMAGTSAGAINTMLLSGVLTRREAEKLGIASESYFPTRSEKLLSYLAAMDLGSIVDGHPMWRKIILGLFNSGSVKDRLVRFIKPYKWAGIGLVVSLLLVLLTSGTGLVDCGTLFFHISRWVLLGAAVIFVLLLIWWIGKGVWLRRLYRYSERLGINPGQYFQDWIHSILLQNGVETVNKLKKRLDDLNDKLAPHYLPTLETRDHQPAVVHSGLAIDALHLIPDEDAKWAQWTVRMSDPAYSIVQLGIELAAAYDSSIRDVMLRQRLPAMVWAFQQRNLIMSGGKPTFPRALVIVSSDLTNEVKVEFPGMHRMYWGNDWEISPAKYVRASMSIPFFFKPFQVVYEEQEMPVIHDEWSKYSHTYKNLGDYAMFVDGGLLSNFPINVFNDPTVLLPRKPTIGIKLEYDDQTVSDPVNNLGAFAGGLLSTMRYFYDRDFLTKNDLYRRTVRSIDTGNISWLNFGMSESEKVELFYRGALAATLFLSSHQLNIEERRVLLKKICARGKKVPLNGTELDIYAGKECDFQSEDIDNLEGDVAFDWEDYKQQVIRSLMQGPDVRKNLKKQASLTGLHSK